MSFASTVEAEVRTRPAAERFQLLPLWLTRAIRQSSVFWAALAAAVALQLWVGAYAGELTNYSDEATHLMNGLLLRDYVFEALGQNPFEYAQRYYVHYPKIAPGMWPPLFHVVLGLLLLAGRSPHATALAFVALANAWTAWRLFSIVTRLAGRGVASIVALLFLITPAAIDLSSVVMLDALVAALALEATYWLARYFSTGRMRHAVAFGLTAAACCLTKGNGLTIVLAPPLAAVIARRPSLLFRRGLVVAAAIVLVLAGPICAMSYRLDAGIGDFGPVTFDQAVERLVFYSQYIWKELGTALTILATLGLALVLARRRTKPVDEDQMLAAGFAALVLAALLFHMFNPHQGIAERYFTLAIAPMLGLGVPAALAIAGLLPPVASRRTVALAVLIVACGAALTTRRAPLSRQPVGWSAAVKRLSLEGLAGERVLVISDEEGEGAFVAEAALAAANPRPTIIRGSKLLASDDWNGHDLRLRFESTAAIASELEALQVTYLVLDGSPQAASLPYRSQIDAVARGGQAKLTYDDQGPLPIRIFRLTHGTTGPAKKLKIQISGLQRTIFEP